MQENKRRFLRFERSSKRRKPGQNNSFNGIWNCWFRPKMTRFQCQLDLSFFSTRKKQCFFALRLILFFSHPSSPRVLVATSSDKTVSGNNTKPSLLYFKGWEVPRRMISRGENTLKYYVATKRFRDMYSRVSHTKPLFRGLYNVENRERTPSIIHKHNIIGRGGCRHFGGKGVNKARRERKKTHFFQGRKKPNRLVWHWNLVRETNVWCVSGVCVLHSTGFLMVDAIVAML